MELSTIDKKIKNFADITPEKIAIRCGTKNSSYKELEDNSNKIAKFLLDNCNESDNVFVIMDKSIELIHSLVGIIKGGKIFIPIDHNFSDNRTLLMLKEIKSKWIITTSNHLDKVCEMIKKSLIEINILIIDKPTTSSSNNNIYNLSDYIEDSSIKYEYCKNKNCYIYFTSGSTGKPKGVLGRHKSLVQFINWEINEFNIDENSVVSQLTPITFDPFLRDVFVPLLSGGTLCIPEEKDIILNPKRLLEWIMYNKITIVHTVPTLFKKLSVEVKTKEDLGDLRYILLAGELLRGNDIESIVDIIGDDIQLVNLYGPTETTLAKFFYRISSNDFGKAIIPVGRPISSCQCYILDKDLKECADEVIGEIYIRTPYISSGYCNDKELTKKVFFSNFFTNNPNDIIYKTGDLGRRLCDKNIEVIGRVDNQVKIRGMRIEIGEVENAILNMSGIKEIKVVADQEEDGSKFLCGYFVAENNFDVNEIRNNLKIHLPEYMIPSYFIRVYNMPINNNGKIDIKKLKENGGTLITGEEYAEPTNEIEKRLVLIWENLLKTTKIGINDDFFNIGGHSLKTLSLVAEAKKEGYDISIKDVFNYRTIKELSKYLTNSDLNSWKLNMKEELLEELRLLGVGGYYKTINILDNSINVLFIYEEEDIDTVEIYKKDIEKIVNPKVKPHYIKLINSDLNIETLEEKQLINMVFNKECEDEIFKSHKNKIKNSIEYNKEELLSQRIIREYPLSGTQKIRLGNPEIMSVVIKLDAGYSNNDINNTLLKIINEQGLLKSKLLNMDGIHLWQEHDIIRNLEIPVFDLIDLNPYIVENVSRKIIDTTLENGKSELFKSLIIKKNLVDNELILLFDHVIFDGFSRQVFKSRFKELMSTNENNLRDDISQYNEYVENISRGPQSINEDEIISMFNLEEFNSSFKGIENGLLQHDCLDNLSLDLTLDYDLSEGKLIDHFKICYEIFSEILSKYLEIKSVPLLLINYGRKYCRKEYYNTIGEFIDYVPFFIDNKKSSFSEEKILELINVASEKNINFSELTSNKELRDKYPKINSLLEDIFNRTFVVFNFQGIGDMEEITMSEKIVEGNYVGNKKLILFNSKVSGNSFKFQVNLPFKDVKQEELEDLINEKFNELINPN